MGSDETQVMSELDRMRVCEPLLGEPAATELRNVLALLAEAKARVDRDAAARQAAERERDEAVRDRTSCGADRDEALRRVETHRARALAAQVEAAERRRAALCAACPVRDASEFARTLHRALDGRGQRVPMMDVYAAVDVALAKPAPEPEDDPDPYAEDRRELRRREDERFEAAGDEPTVRGWCVCGLPLDWRERCSAGDLCAHRQPAEPASAPAVDHVSLLRRAYRAISSAGPVWDRDESTDPPSWYCAGCGETVTDEDAGGEYPDECACRAKWRAVRNDLHRAIVAAERAAETT